MASFLHAHCPLFFFCVVFIIIIFPTRNERFLKYQKFFFLGTTAPSNVLSLFSSFADGEEKKCKLYLKFDEQCFFGHSFVL